VTAEVAPSADGDEILLVGQGGNRLGCVWKDEEVGATARESMTMANVSAVEISEVLGIQATDDGTQMLVGFKTATGEELVIALAQDAVVDVLNDFLEATSIIPFKKGDADQAQHAFDVDSFELAKVKGTEDIALTLMREKAHISFRLPAGMGQKILETLLVMFGKAAAAGAVAKPS
jgi:hypothetical protein